MEHIVLKEMGISTLDWIVIIFYFLIFIIFSIYLGKSQKNNKDYFLGGREISSWAIGLSIMATQCSAISLIGVPAFVAIKPGGGLSWLQYEFAVPLAMIFIMAIFVPFFYNSNVVTVYEYLEKRFGSGSRTFLSAVFLISRGLATGCAIYAPAVVLSACMRVDIKITIMLMGIISVIYTAIGGIKAVIYTDVIQVFILWGSVLLCIAIAISVGGGFNTILSGITAQRMTSVDFSSTGLFDGQTFAFWPMLIGGFFLYVSYYGCDQSQIQRVLCSKSIHNSKKSLFYNGLLRFPLVLTYCIFGIVLAGFIAHNTEIISLLPRTIDSTGREIIHYNFLVPLFIIKYLPVGLVGFAMAGIFAAAMSSLDSAFNSLSAATMRDFYERFINPNAGEKTYLWWSRITTLLWGIICTLFAFLIDPSSTVVESINKIGSAFYGPLLGAFILATMTKRVNGTSNVIGILAGLLINIILWQKAPNVSWFWWNAFGCIITVAFGYAVSFLTSVPKEETLKGLTYFTQDEKMAKETSWKAGYLILLAFFIVIILISILMGRIAQFNIY